MIIPIVSRVSRARFRRNSSRTILLPLPDDRPRKSRRDRYHAFSHTRAASRRRERDKSNLRRSVPRLFSPSPRGRGNIMHPGCFFAARRGAPTFLRPTECRGEEIKSRHDRDTTRAELVRTDLPCRLSQLTARALFSPVFNYCA